MARLTEYPQATTFDTNDILIKDGTNGTKKITVEDIAKYMSAKAKESLKEAQLFSGNPTFLYDGFIQYSDGSRKANSSWRASYWYDVTGIRKIIYARCGLADNTSSTAGMGFYSSASFDDFISGERVLLNTGTAEYALWAIDVPSGAKYAAFSRFVSDTVSGVTFAVYDYDKYMEALSDCIGIIKEQSWVNFDSEMQIGIYMGRQIRRYFDSSYTYGYTICPPISVGVNQHVLVRCPGYYVRFNVFTDESVMATTYTGIGTYCLDEAYVYTSASYVDMSVTVRKDPNDSTALTGAEMDDIKSKLVFMISENVAIDEKVSPIKKVIAPSPSKYIADKNYAVGDFLITDNRLFKVTSAIANGGSIIPDTNAEETTVGEQLTLLWAAVNSNS